ncbi:MAG: glycosyltransferase family 39 protein [Candidatus Eremiobacteraeota bacterium]|nr:glycosyltransferase family 39 protein [Candidatus Eremiobacteraeota bacterium]
MPQPEFRESPKRTLIKARIFRYAVPVALGLILLLGAVLRLYDIGGVPTELDADEIDLYNSAYSIATTGHDLDGTLLPFFYSPVTRNPPIYAIAAYASALTFGRTPLGLRLPAVIFGLIAIGLLYGIGFELTKRRDVATIAALLMATQPIFVHFARIGWEPASELPFLLGGIYLMLRALGYSMVPIGTVFGAALVLALTAYTYMAGWFYAVLLGGALLAFNLRRFASWRGALTVAGACAMWLLVSAPALWMWFFDPHTVSHTLNMATFAGGVSLGSIHTFFVNYAAHFYWSYLVTTGDPKPAITWRYLNGMGAFFGWVVPLAALGLAASAKYIRPRWALVWTWLWLASYPLGGALTNQGAPGTPNAPRTLAGAPVFCILAAIGSALIFDWAASVRKPGIARSAGVVARAIFATVMVFSTVYFAHFYFTGYVHRNSNAWFSGTGALFAAIRQNRNEYRRICFEVRPAWYPLKTFGLFYLDDVSLRVVNGVDVQQCTLPGTLAAVDNDHPFKRPGFRILAKIVDVDGNPFANLSGHR